MSRKPRTDAGPLGKLAAKHDTTVQLQAKKLGYTVKAALYARVSRGWTPREAFFTPKGQTPARLIAEREYVALLGCRRREQQRKRAARKRFRRTAILIDGEYVSPKEACRRTGITRAAAYARMKKGWSRQRAFTTPPTRSG